MNPAIAKMRAAGGVSLPSRSVPLYLAQGLVARAEALDEEYERVREAHDAAVAEAQEAAESSSKKAVSRVATPEPPARLTKIDVEREAVYAEMRDYRATLTVTAESAGAWRRWADDHPAREGNVTDKRVGFDVVDTSALLARLGDFFTALDGDPVSSEDKTFVLDNAAPGALTELCRDVVLMQEGQQIRPKASRTDSSATPTSETA